MDFLVALEERNCLHLVDKILKELDMISLARSTSVSLRWKRLVSKHVVKKLSKEEMLIFGRLQRLLKVNSPVYLIRYPI